MNSATFGQRTTTNKCGMPVEVMHCVNCVKMDYDVEEGIPKDFIEFDFAEDALDFEVSL